MWKPRFDPEAFAKDLKDKTLEDFRFSEQSLKDYVKKVSKLRKAFRDQVEYFRGRNETIFGDPITIPSAILQRI